MCGRFTHRYTWEELHDLLDLRWDGALADPKPSCNVAPTQAAPILRTEGAAMLRWGLVPSWAKDERIGSRMINARAETVAEKPAFRAAFKRRRCIVPVSGFYEWTATADGKQPHYIYSADGGLLLLSALWEQRDELESFTILTCAANGFMESIHDRMPVILSSEGAEHWLDAPDPTLLIPAAAGVLASHPVSKRVNNVRNDDPSLVEPIE